MVIGNRPPCHQGRNHGYAGQLGEFHRQRRSVGIDHAATDGEQWPLGGIQHAQRFFDLGARCRWPIDRQRFIGIGIKFDLGHLYVKRHIDQHRAGTAGTHQMECLLEYARHQRRFAHGDRPLGDRLGNRLDIDCLEIFFIQTRTRRLPGDAQDRDRIRLRRIQAGNHIGAGRTGSADAQTDIAGIGAGITFCHVRRTFDVTCQHMLDAAMPLECRVEWIDRCTRHTECLQATFFFQYIYCGVYCFHLCHISSRLCHVQSGPGDCRRISLHVFSS